MSTIGASVVRNDGRAKVRGETVYAVDYEEGGTIYGALLRSPVAAGRIVRIDTSKARAMPGVRAVITAADVPETLAGWLLRDTPLFARGVVRYVGEPVAAVAADTLDQARAAAGAIALEIEETEAVTDIRSALAAGAPLVHPDWRSYELAAGIPEFPREGNIAAESVADPGDIAAEFAGAALIVEDEFESQRQYQAFLEPKSALGIYRDGRYVVHAGTQFPFNVRDRMAQYFAVAPSDVRVINHAYGGGFGGKLDAALEPHAVALSKAAGGRPVKLVNTRQEDLATANARESTLIKIRSALDAEGNIIARDLECYLDNGAYTGEMAAFACFAFHCAGANYRVGKLRAVGRVIYTNTPPTAAFRGITGIALYAALETHMDHIAAELGVDRREYRLRHVFREGDKMPSGQVLEDAGILKEGFEAVEKIAPWVKLSRKRAPHRGVGLAAAVWLVNPMPGAATVKLDEDGTVSVVTGANDNGSGALATGVAQIVAEVLGISPEKVRISDADTDFCAYDGGCQGSRTTQTVGNAARMAAEEARAKALAEAAKLLQAEPGDLEIVDGAVRVKARPGSAMSLAQVAAAATFGAGPIQGTGRALIPPVPFNPGCASGLLFPFFTTPTYHVHLAEVEVDPVTGNIKVLRYIVAQEVGRVVNPASIAGQIQGGVAQGIGYALYESLRYGADGKAIENTFKAYRLPVAPDVPRVEYVLMEHPNENGPFGAKGMAECPILLPAAAIACAVSDAVGRPIRKIPVTPEDVLAALAGGS